MKIGIFDPYLGTLGGGEKYMLTAASCLSNNHQVSIFWNDTSILEKAKDRFSIDLSRVSLTKNIFSKNVGLFSRLLQTKKYDLLIVLSDGSIPFTLAKKLIVHFQFPVEWVDGKQFLTQKKVSRIYKIICNSHFTKDYIDKTFNMKSIVLYPPADTQKKSTLLTKKNVILTVGRLAKTTHGSYFKKQDVMISVFKKMIDKGLSNWQFVVAVSCLDRDEKLLEELQNFSKHYPILVVANVPHERLEMLYKEAKIYWHATGFGEDLKKHPELAEHFGITTVEAMSNGAVPVVFNGGGQKEIVIDMKNGAFWESEDQLIERTQELIEKKNMWTELSKASQKRAELFSEEKFCDHLEQIIT